MTEIMNETFKLNEAQAKAVAITDGPALVVAGAGTGKTKVIVERIAKLIEQGIDKRAILALTFTEKAAQEMLDRVSEQLDGYGVDLPIYTFNGFGQEMLREFAIEIGLNPNLKLVGDTGKVVLLREHLDELGLDYFSPISSPDGQLANLADYYSQLKQQLVKPADYVKFANDLPATDEAEQLEKQRHQELAQSYATYISICRSKNIIDYDDQLYLLVELLESRPNVLKRLHERYSHILVDEFQDTNPMQSRVLDLLAEQSKNLMVVGDDDQSIYGWRGATLANILEFTQRYPETHEVTLTENYRSTQAILDASYTLIQNNNPDRLEVINNLDKKLTAFRGRGEAPLVRHFSHLDAELEWVAHDVRAKIDSGIEPHEIAILARRAVTVKRIHTALEQQGIEHAVAGVTSSLYAQPMVAMMIETLKALVDAHDNQAVFHALNSPLFSIESRTLSDASATARRQHKQLLDVLRERDDEDVTKQLDQFDAWREVATNINVGQLSYTMLDESGLKDDLYRKANTSEADALTVQALGTWFSTLRDFEQVSEVASASNYVASLDALKAENELLADDANDIDSSMPIVMTVHKSKGLEWKVVYVVDCTQGSFPLRARGGSLIVPEELRHSSRADDHLAEERRLMYVAATRARDSLVLTYSDTHTGTTKRQPSPFLSEMFGELTDATHDAQAQTNLDLFNIDSEASTAKVTLPSSMFSGDKLVLTASQANDYLRCPLDFRYRHILGVPPEPNPTAMVGTVFHNFIQQINDAKLHGTDVPKLSDLQATMKNEWPQEGYLSAKQRERALESALKALETTYQRMHDEPIPVASEEPFRVHIPDSKLILKGRIDVVMPHEGGVEIRDYKTSTSATTPEKAKRSAQGSKQLDMYALAWKLTHHEMPSVVSLDFVQTGQIGSVKKKEKTLDSLAEKLAKAADDILAGTFEPGTDHRYCRHPLDD